MSLYLIGYPESIFKFALSGSFKNAFRRLPRRAYSTARNDDRSFRPPEIDFYFKKAKSFSSLFFLNYLPLHDRHKQILK
ncbi:MAG: hypothetical protein J6W29_05325 [Neisseriaceae bacterium]|nr:hypothetical protein [Neisseriaceae bacterium]